MNHAKYGISVNGLGVALLAIVLSSCVSVGVVKLSQNTARIVVEASAFHRADDAQHWAFRQGATPPPPCGFDRFIVLSTEADGRNAGDFGSTPVDAFTIRMYRSDEPSPDALDAREVLGEDWEITVARDRRSIAGCE